MRQPPDAGGDVRQGRDTFSPCGPYLTLREDVPDPQNLAIAAAINADAELEHQVHDVQDPQIIAYVSRRMTLETGDILQTGVPAPVVPLTAGDTIEITIERLGTLRNRVIADAAAAPR